MDTLRDCEQHIIGDSDPGGNGWAGGRVRHQLVNDALICLTRSAAVMY